MFPQLTVALRTGQLTLDAITKDLAVSIKQHPQYPNLHHFSYHQWLSPMENPIVQECRGIILDKARAWRPVCWAFNKFFNYNEALAAPIDWATARITEKLDGSLICVWWYAGQWHASTTGTPDASGTLPFGGEKTFAQLFWEVAGEQQACPVQREFTYMFELTTPYNQVVVQHQTRSVTLIGARNMESGWEVQPEVIHELQHALPKPPEIAGYFLGTTASIHTAVSAAGRLNPVEHEGYVVVDHAFRRVKVKSPRYLELHRLRDNVTERSLLSLVLSGEMEEIVGYFPQYTADFVRVIEQVDAFCTLCAQAWEECRDLPSRKDFALAVKHLPYAPVLFALKDHRVATPRNFLTTCTQDGALRMLEAVSKQSSPVVARQP